MLQGGMQCQDVHEDVWSLLSTISGIDLWILWEDIGSRVEQPFNVLPLRLCCSFHEYSKNSLLSFVSAMSHVSHLVSWMLCGCTFMQSNIVQVCILCHPLRESVGPRNSQISACRYMPFKIVIQRYSTQCNAASRWQYCQTVPCLLSTQKVFLLGNCTSAHVRQIDEVEQSCIQIIRRRIHRHRVCLGTD